MNTMPKKRKSRGGAKPVDLEVLWRDLPALAKHLESSPDTQRWAAHTQGELAKGIAMADGMPPGRDRDKWLADLEAMRWNIAEEMLWQAASGEVFDRRKADIRSGKIRDVRATMGMGWKPSTRVVKASVGMPWRRRVCDLLEHPSIKGGVDFALFPILLDLVKVALDDQAEAYRLRDKPDVEAIQTRQSRDESNEAPEGMESIVKRLEQYRDAKHAEGRSRVARSGGEGKNKESRAARDSVFQYLDTNRGSLPMYSGRPNQKRTADQLADMPEFQDYELETIKGWVKEWADARNIGYKPSKKNKRTGKG